MSKRLADDIKRIVDIDEDQEKLPKAKAREPISGSRGIGYGNLNNIQSATGAVPSGTGTGSTTDPFDPQNTLSDSTTGVKSATDLLDGLERLRIGDKLRGIDGATDCDSGKDLDIRFDGIHVPPLVLTDEDGYQYTNAWENDSTPPAKVDATVGDVWTITISGINYHAASWTDFISTVKSIFDSVGTPTYGVPPHTFTRIANQGFTSGELTSCDLRYDDSSDPVVEFGTPLAQKTTKAFPANDSTNVTVSDSYTVEEYAQDDAISLSFDGATWSASQYENSDDMIPKYDNNNEYSRLDFCLTGGRFGTVEATKDGGFMFYETSSEGGAATGEVMLFDGNQNFRGYTTSDLYTDFRPEQS